jgi:hypothetical protein
MTARERQFIGTAIIFTKQPRECGERWKAFRGKVGGITGRTHGEISLANRHWNCLLQFVEKRRFLRIHEFSKRTSTNDSIYIEIAILNSDGCAKSFSIVFAHAAVKLARLAFAGPVFGCCHGRVMAKNLLMKDINPDLLTVADMLALGADAVSAACWRCNHHVERANHDAAARDNPGEAATHHAMRGLQVRPGDAARREDQRIWSPP